MTLEDIVLDIQALRIKLGSFERKYGVLSETFYESYKRGEEPANDAWVSDWAIWAGTYKVIMRRQEQYQKAIKALENQSDILMSVIERTAKHEPISITV